MRTGSCRFAKIPASAGWSTNSEAYGGIVAQAKLVTRVFTKNSRTGRTISRYYFSETGAYAANCDIENSEILGEV